MPESWFPPQMVQRDPWPIAEHVLVIAEIGINHNGDVGMAKQLVEMAKEAGCDAVKFQKRTVELVYTEEALATPRESPWGHTMGDQKHGLEFGETEFDEIDAWCKQLGIDWFASSWDLPSQEFLRRYDLKYNKIASALLTHPDLLAAVAAERKLTFISTGMSRFDDIDRAVAVFDQADCPYVLMHTVSEYPVDETRLNLSLIHELRRRYSCPVGYSGHEVTPIPSVFAAVMGAVAVERHITLDRAMYGTDQAASLEKRGLEMMVGYIRTIPRVLGEGQKEITPVEAINAKKLRYWAPPVR